MLSSHNSVVLPDILTALSHLLVLSHCLQQQHCLQLPYANASKEQDVIVSAQPLVFCVYIVEGSTFFTYSVSWQTWITT